MIVLKTTLVCYAGKWKRKYVWTRPAAKSKIRFWSTPAALMIMRFLVATMIEMPNAFAFTQLQKLYVFWHLFIAFLWFSTTSLFLHASFFLLFLHSAILFLWVQRLFVFVDELRFISCVNIKFNMMHQINVCSLFLFHMALERPPDVVLFFSMFLKPDKFMN